MRVLYSDELLRNSDGGPCGVVRNVLDYNKQVQTQVILFHSIFDTLVKGMNLFSLQL